MRMSLTRTHLLHGISEKTDSINTKTCCDGLTSLLKDHGTIYWRWSKNLGLSLKIFERINKYTVKTDCCWLWSKSKSVGYGVLNVGDNKIVRVHRISVILSGRIIPDGMEVDHLCRNPACLRPSHLEVVTPAENNRRGKSVAALNYKKTHCINGHEFNVVNTYIRDGKYRQCKECCRIRKVRDSKLKSEAYHAVRICSECGAQFRCITWPNKERKFCNPKCSSVAAMRAYKIRQQANQ